MWLPHSFIVLVLASLVRGGIINTTIDDSSSSFNFTGTWNTITPTLPCTGCAAQPDPSQVYNGTWHDGNTQDGAPAVTGGSFTFTGSAVYIFGIDQAESQPDIAFTLGSIQQVHHYTGSEAYVYNALFFSATGLSSDQTHTANWVFNVADTTSPLQVALFDYAVVTSGDDETTLPSSTSTQHTTSSNKATSSSISPTSSAATSSSSTGTSSSVSASSSANPASGMMTVTTDSAGETITVTVAAQSTGSKPTTKSNSNLGAPTTKSNSNLGAIVGGGIGALAVVILVILLLWFRRRRARRFEAQSDKVARAHFLRLEDYPPHYEPVFPRTNTREVGRSVPMSSSSGSKIRHRNNASVTGATLYPSPDGHTTATGHSEPSRPSPEELPTVANDTLATETSTNLQVLEERLAMLEALTVHQLPPAYIPEE
ncbi:hypothetical protein MSAN_01031100 [Mycena sanguinolenta]|uniref:Uncharacterized protein n=1 Tax=Mycena sanguinolenta TaxID=230812 RepID=A0A8H7D9F0_9AGAR|nr:hypothetical protein MSAN_01031100 [Mycena sanguinolenta]